MRRTLPDILSAKLSIHRGLSIIERQRIEDVLDELHRSDSIPIDGRTAVEIGNLLGANIMVFGSYSKLLDRIIVTIRLVKVETGEIVGGIVEKGNSIKDLDGMATRAYEKLLDELKADLQR